jgi:protein arginine N-methyltransferase 1
MKNELGQFIPLHYHFQMLSDKNRMNAFEKAISDVVLPSHKVVDLGTGTGVMAFNAAKKSVKVWGIEYNPELVSCSRKLMKKNGVTDRIEIIQSDAMEWMPDEPVDVVVCEMLHSALLREKQVEVISKFRDEHFNRFNKTPIFLPTATLLGVQPVWQNYDFAGFKASIPLFQDAYARDEDLTPLCDPMVYETLAYNNAEMKSIKGDMIFELQSDARINALRFITKNILSMNLVTGETVDWHNQHLIIPLDNEIQIKSGQEIRVRFNYLPGDPIEKLHDSIQINIFSKCDESKQKSKEPVRIVEIKPPSQKKSFAPNKRSAE